MSLNGQADLPSENGPNKATGRNDRQGARTHVLLVFAMALVIVSITSLSLFLIRQDLRVQITDNLSQDLNHSVVTFQSLQAERLEALERENALLADLPPLKALMTSGDDLTIQDGAVEFWQLSGADLFALADATGRIVAAYTKVPSADTKLRQGLKTLLAHPDKHYLIDGESLYACSVRPFYFGSDEEGTLLGYVVSGSSTERTVRQMSQPTAVEATFLSRGQIVASTLPSSIQPELAQKSPLISKMLRTPAFVQLGDTRFLAFSEDLSATATSPLQLVVLKSFGPAERWISRIDRTIVLAGLMALLLGTGLMIGLSRLVTRPLEELSKSVRAFGIGNREYLIPQHGTQEVRQLSSAFARMRDEIQQVNGALLESERLATIGRMASSVSHDLRHYLAAIYANAEFLASDRLLSKERSEIFADIRSAVHGTTDMIESLLIFSRSGKGTRRSAELMVTLLERATSLARQHPDAEGVVMEAQYGEPTETAVVVDGKQIERAIFNLLINACQSVRASEDAAKVAIVLQTEAHYVFIKVIDNGAGVPENIRNTLFEPFVSEGKQKGTGLGLTLAHCIAAEHGGEVVLLSSRPGETIFQMKVARNLPEQDMTVTESKHRDQVAAHENVQI
ncbi:sensor histidine kinase [Acidobacterium sp. S8]|uniref:sensor histidine kinase n=1 Tax=Acidobacterium sp. S8 TaxID=1641854 RepID=UPI00131A9C36|nr:HAMP domain-containing sensor histidine kinase [Acidobacterium sp. S8]